DLDVGAAFLNGIIDPVEVDSREARRVLRKIDMFLLPILAFTYMIQFLDKSCVSYSALWGMVEDAHLANDQYSWLTTIGHNFAGLATARLFLGILEAGWLLQTIKFFFSVAHMGCRSEQPLRTSIWFSMNGFANILGGLIAYEIGHLHGALPAWKFPFINFGSITFVWGIIIILVARSNPTKAKWRSGRERILRVLENKTGIDNKTFKMEQVKEALLDPRFWLINLHCLANTIPTCGSYFGAVSAFAPLIVNGFGFTKFESTLLGMPSGASQVLALWISGYLATRLKGIRHFLMIGGLLVALLGGVLIFALPESNRAGRLM
ncbi:hypothetical protein N7537_004485, partial [Penicillium hordei]